MAGIGPSKPHRLSSNNFAQHWLVPMQILEKAVTPLLSGFYDTPFITWLLKTRPEYRSKVRAAA